MKILKVLVATDCNNFTQMLVQYFIDCGHQISILSNAYSAEWRAVINNYNLDLVNVNNTNALSYDILINFDDNFSEYAIPTLFCNLDKKETLITIGLRKNSANLVLLKEEIFFNKLNNFNVENLQIFFQGLIELFIDSISIFLQSNNHLTYKKDISFLSCNFFKLLQLDKKFQSLINYYCSQNIIAEQFKIGTALIAGNIEYESFLSVDYWFNQELLEIFFIYLITLYNSRNNALYTYDLKKDSKKITKCINLNITINYSDFNTLINNENYEVINNPYYFFDELNGEKSEVLVAYDSEEDLRADYLVKINFSSKNNSLLIFYPRNLLFFDDLEKIIANFFGQFQDWKAKNFSFYKFLCVDQNFLLDQQRAFNQTDKQCPVESVHKLFEQQVKKTSNHIALVYEKKQLTYRELNEKANQLAHYLNKTYQIQKDDLVALCLDRSEYMLVAMLAVLKSGGAYVPLEPTYSNERLAYLLEDVNCKVVLTETAYQEKFQELKIGSSVESRNSRNTFTALLTLDHTTLQKELALYPINNLKNANHSHDLAYVIYTSGTSGNPKGVMVEHEALTNFVNMQRTFLTSEDIGVSCVNYTFDAIHAEIYPLLLNGNTLHIVNDSIRRNLEALYDYTVKNSISYLVLPSILASEFSLYSAPLKLRLLITGGGVYTGVIPKSFTIINQYGPTETTVCATLRNYVPNDFPANIGKPIANTQIYLLDHHLIPVPVGVIGELYVGGAGLARGYLNQPALTSERFIANPFQTEEERAAGKNSRLYKTGDLARYLTDGNIEYIGRNDFQVKLRGYRIELGEIEKQLVSFPAIKQSVVLMKNEGESAYLAGYYVSDQALDEAEIMLHLRMHLPEYMIPQILMHLTELPLIGNGKLDRKSLPEPVLVSPSHYVAPRNEREHQICSIYAEVLDLPLESIGIRDDFFQLGGNSILAIKLVNRLKQRWMSDDVNSCSVTIARLFQYRTIENLLKMTDQAIEKPLPLIPVLSYSERERAEGGDKRACLSYAQGRLWFIENYEQGKAIYNIPLRWVLADGVNIECLESALQRTVSRHEVLYSRIKTDESGEGYQEVGDLIQTPVRVIRHVLSTQEELEYYLKKASDYVFDLTKEYPIRLSLYAVGDQHYLSVVVHHIAFDGWSIDVFVRDLQAYYDYEGLNLAASILPDLRIQYRDFAVWQREYLTDERLESQVAYWREKLRTYETLQLPTDKPRPSRVSYEGESVVFQIEKEASQGLRALAKALKVSLYSVLLAGFNLLLRSYARQDDIVIGTAVANRHYPELENLVGFFVNSLVLRSQIVSSQRIEDYIHQIGEEVMEAHLHQDLPFEKLVEMLQVEQDTSRHPLFQVMFNVQHFGQEKTTVTSLFHKQTESIHLTSYSVARFDLTVIIDDSNEVLQGDFNYATSLFNRSTIEQLISTYCYLLTQISENPAKEISKLSYLDPFTYQQVVYNWNENETAYSENQTIHGLFEEQVTRTPNAIAIVYDDIQLTYSELNKRANQLAHYLQKTYDIQGNDLVAIYLERSELMLIAILGVLKSGAGYVPIDLTNPDARIQFILEDTNAKAVIRKDIFDDGRLDRQLIVNLNPNISNHHLAYVMYTSGTTGTPKGVMIEHRGVVAFVSHAHYIDVKSGDGVLGYSDSAFDGSVFDLFTTLLNGATLYWVDKSCVLDTGQFNMLIRKGKISHIFTTTALFQYYLLSENNPFARIPHILMGGEKANSLLLSRFVTEHPNVELIHVYGPTENIVFSTSCVLNKKNVNVVPIGKPLNNKSCYILDDYLTPVPVGGIGELYVGGAGLARGYLNQPTLTVERFIANPFQTEEEKAANKNSRLYKTGDLGRYLSDGNIEYIGRNDFQVKLRGYRIELSEIEKQIVSFRAIKQSVVLMKGEGESAYLAGYYVSEQALDEAEITLHLRLHLPEYMVPQVLIYLTELPLNGNGKIDRARLPEPAVMSTSDYVAPRNEVEQQICAIYAEVLNLPIESIGIQDDFFRLGGNSILAIKLVNRLNQEWSKDEETHFTVTIARLFQCRTIENLLKPVEKAIEKSLPLIPVLSYSEQEKATGLDKRTPLSYAQGRLWFIENYESGIAIYNIPLIWELADCVNIAYLEKALQRTVSRHEILYSRIQTDELGVGYQEVGDLIQLPVRMMRHVLSTSEELAHHLKKASEYVFDLTKEYPIRLSLYALGGQHYLSVVVHHIAFDGWSIDVFISDLQAYYDELISDREGVALPDLRIQYRDFSVWQREYLSNERLESQVAYWREKLQGYETLQLPTDKPRPSRVSYEGESVFFEIEKETSQGLRALAKTLKVSLYSVLLAGFNLLLRSYAHQDDIVLGTAVANRHYPELENLVGFFVNSLVLRSQIVSNQRIEDYILQIGEQVMEAHLHQDLPFEKLVESLQVEQDTSRHPLFQVMFNVHNFGQKKKTLDSLFKANEQIELIHQATFSVARFDLTVTIEDSAEVLKGDLNYATSLFNRTTIEQFISIYRHLLNQIVIKPALAISTLTYLDHNTYERVVVKWNDTKRPYPENKTIQTLFEEQVIRTPHHIALVYKDKKLTYAELNEQANQLAYYLRRTYDIQADDLITLCLERSEYLLISILGVLKSGAAYIPIDPGYPDERVHYILSDTLPKVLIINVASEERLKCFVEVRHPLFVIDSKQSQVEIAQEITSNPALINNSHHLAYVIYTSGTTGLPKGVMIEHHAVNNLTIAKAKACGLELYINSETTAKNSVLYASYVFDAHVWQIFSIILNGHSLHLLSDETRKDLKLLKHYIISQKIFVADIPPALLNANEEEILPVDILVVGGDKTKNSILETYYKNNIRIINCYGPTEATVCASIHSYKMNDISNNIGHPLYNTSIYILDENLNPVPLGGIGELYIGGVGLARGYLNQPQLTSECFIANAFQTEEERAAGKNSRLYKTSDLGRYLVDGCIEYLGRNDSQIKLRGYRIELGEIESTIMAYVGVKQAIVKVFESEQKDSRFLSKLVGYYVSDKPLDEEGLRRHVAQHLPEYMVPVSWMHLIELPMTVNGKIDKNALLLPDVKIDDTYVAPRDELERQICALYAEVLGVPGMVIGIQQDFFQLGGDSIVSIQLASRLRQRLNLDISIKDIFNYRTVKDLYDQVLSRQDVSHSLETICDVHERGILVGEVNLLPIQQWFFYQVEEGNYRHPAHWNQVFLIKVEKLDRKLLLLSVEKLVAYHDALRLRYSKDAKGEIFQNYCSNFRPSLHYIDRSTLSEKEYQRILTTWQSDFNLSDTLYRVGYIEGYSDGSCRVYLAFHHLIIDIVSWHIITEDLKTLYQKFYEAKAAGTLASISERESEEILGKKETSYRQWSNILHSYTLYYPMETDYWSTVLPELNSLARSFESSVENEESFFHQATFRLGVPTTQLLLLRSNQCYHTEINDLLLSAFGLALFSWCGEAGYAINLEGHGREMLDALSGINITHTVGWFTSQYPVKLTVDPTSVEKTIIQVKETLRKIPRRGIGYGALYGYINPALPRISFNYLGQFGTSTPTLSNWNITREIAGIAMSPENISQDLLQAVGSVIDGQLEFTVKGRWSEAKMQLLAQAFKVSVETVIKETATPNRSYWTGSDINYLISPDYLTRIQKKREIGAVYLANSLQQGFIYHALNQGEKDSAYRVQMVYRYTRALKQEYLKVAWKGAIKRYPSLRLRFAWEESLIQIVDKEGVLNWVYEDLSTLDKASQEARKALLIQEDRAKNYDLSEGSLLRLYLLKETETQYTCLQSNHHAILDGWSTPVLLNYVHDLYKSLEKGISYEKALSSIVEENAYIESQRYLQMHHHESERYWQETLKGIENNLDLSGLFKASCAKVKLGEHKHIEEHKEQVFKISKEDYAQSKAFARSVGITLNALIQYCWHKLLQVYGHSDVTIVGTTVSGRNLPIDEIESSVGLHINTLPLVVSHASTETIQEGLLSFQEKITELNLHSAVNLSSLQEGGRRLFDCLFVYENYPTPTSDGNSLEIIFEQGVEEFDYPLALVAYEWDACITVKLKYAGELFAEETINILLRTLLLLIRQIVNGEVLLSQELSYLDREQYQRVVYDWNETRVEYPTEETLISLFEAQVMKSPNKEALVYEGKSLTYRELNEGANQLGHYLRREYEIKADDLVALYIERSEYMVIGLLGILKAGGAYVPVDTEYPAERVSYILDDTRAKVILTQLSQVNALQAITRQACLVIDRDELIAEEKTNLASLSDPRHLAYVIYTSGTTGRPKGVMIEHRQVVSFLHSIQLLILDKSTSMDVWLALTNIVFDISFLEIMGALLSGLKVVLLENRVLDAMQSVNYSDKPMNFGLFYFGNYSNSQEEKESKYKLFIEGSKFADQHNFTFVSTPERHFDIFGGLYPNPTVTSAALSTITKHVQIRTGSLVLPLHNLIRVAEDFALIDNLSEGRVGLSLATGWNKNDYTLMPQNFTERRKILRENLEILRRLWRGESVDFVGVDNIPHSVKTFPQPIQQEIPVWLTIANSAESFEQAGQMGVNILTHLLGQSIEELAEKIKVYKKALSLSHHSEANKQITLMIHTFVTSCEKYALEQVKEPFKNYLKTSIDLLKKVFPEENVDNLDHQEMDTLLEHAFERYYYTSGLFGTPQSCQKMIDKLKAIGVTEIACLIDFGIENSIVLENLAFLNQLRLSSQPQSSNKINDIIKHHQITHIQLTPSLGKMIFKSEDRDSLKSIKKVLVGGEKLSISLAEKIKEITSASLYHMYGPTETAIWSTYNLVNNNPEKIVIGRALKNETTYVLNPTLQPVPIGAVGELYIGGAGLARGYLNQLEMTEEKFIVNPFQTEDEKQQKINSRLYKTGDLVRYLPTGNLEFISRNDTQVKLRGYRIELSEIEEVLLKSNKAIQQTVVILQQDAEDSEKKYLVGYYVSPEVLDESLLFNYLKSHLPNYMIPRAMLWLNQLPLTRNGKLDHAALPSVAEQKEGLYIAPRNDTEKMVCAIFADVLSVDLERVSIQDDFLQLGGDSILAVRLVNQLATQASIKISLADLFQSKTIEAIAMERPQKETETIWIPRLDETEN
jgi:natural product biosynthesis luciferase-like monooxygenase protein/amino acid adenylation domain-containing protein/non-ribosomal peptide synthase protein (TIGR01720 family)